MRVRIPRPSLLQAFGVVSLLVIALLGVTAGTILHSRIERRASADAERLAIAIARVGIAGQVHSGELDSGPLSAHRIADLDDWFSSSGLLRGKLYDKRGRIAWSDDHAFIGRNAIDHDEVREALEGHIEVGVEENAEELGAKGRFTEVYVPIRGGVFESYMSYAPTARAIASDTRILILTLVGGLLALWAALFRTVARASRRLRHQASHDALTGLSNRAELYELGERALAGAQRDGALAALLLIDLDRFKEVNDTIGHEQGDHLLVEVATRLRGVLRSTDILARLGGDEFAVLAVLPNRGALGEVATRLQSALARPFELGGVAIELGASIGIAVQPDHGDDVSTLLRHADVAMYEAKRAATGIETYDPERDPYSPERLALLGELRRGARPRRARSALPAQGRTAGAARRSASRRSCAGSTPSAGCSAPGEFLGARRAHRADRRHHPLGPRRGAAPVRRVAARGHRPARRRQPRGGEHRSTPRCPMRSPRRCAAGRRPPIAWSARSPRTRSWPIHGAPPTCSSACARWACACRSTTSAPATRRCPTSSACRVDEVKIDRSFVSGMADDASDAAIVRSTIDLARHLGLAVVAEGVETTEVLDVLASLDCDVAQGFLLSRPLPAGELGVWLAAAG